MLYPGQTGRPELGTFMLKDTAVINGYLKTPQVRSLLSRKSTICKICMGYSY